MVLQGSSIKPNYKPIENFLRRVAFNLGNTPSQTEVKIISCIPIDVTDLQNRITDLERELEKYNTQSNTGGTAAEICVAVGGTSFKPNSTSIEQFIPTSPDTPGNNSPALEDNDPALDDPESNSPKTVKHTDNVTSDAYKEPKNKHKLQNLSKPHKKKLIEKPYRQNHMVYYSRPIYSNRTNKKKARGSKRNAKDEDMNRGYLEDLVQRQYQPAPVPVEPSTSSKFSWPVCRDEPSVVPLSTLYNSVDGVSSCLGPFYNLDNNHEYSNETNMFYDSSLYDIVPVKERPNKSMNQMRDNAFLDHDAFPSEYKKYHKQSSQQQYYADQCVAPVFCRNGPRLRCKRRTTSTSAIKREKVIRAMQKLKHVDEEPLFRLQTSASNCIEKEEVYARQRVSKIPPPAPRATTGAQLAPVMMPVAFESPQCIKVILNNSECQTVDCVVQESAQLEPATTSLPPPSAHDNKTELTLNSIKNILQAVLIEVKTSTQVKNTAADKAKKDADVQNGKSHSDMATSSKSINTSPHYSACGPMNRPVPGNGVCYPTCLPMPPLGHLSPPIGCISCPSPKTGLCSLNNANPFGGNAKCMQNYPVFIQTTGRQCNCYYRSVPQSHRKPAAPQQVTTHTANNTDSSSGTQDAPVRETDKLIKEIYKSLAVNVSVPVPKKEPSISDTSTIISNKTSDNSKIKPRVPKCIVSDIVRSPNKTQSQQRWTFANQFGGKHDSNSASYRSEIVSGTTTKTGSRELVRKPSSGLVRSLLAPREHQGSIGSGRATHKQGERGRGYSHSSEEEASDTETPSTDDTNDSDATVTYTDATEKTNEKTGFFSKMMKFFKTRRGRRRRPKETSSSSSSEISSSEYETVYSKSSRDTQRRVKFPDEKPFREPERRRHHARPRLPVLPVRRYTPPVSTRLRRSPAPDERQEYRNHWQDELPYRHRKMAKVPSDLVPEYGSQQHRRRRQKTAYTQPDYGPYWRQYEAHAAIVPPPTAAQPRYPYPPQRPSSRCRQYPVAAPFPPQHSAPAPQYPASQYPASQYPASQYPASQYPASQYPAPAPQAPPQNITTSRLRDQISKCGQTESAVRSTLDPKPVKKAPKGLGWFKQVPKCGGYQCGVQWKKVLLES